MTRRPQIRMLPDGRRLHLQDGPIDLVIRAYGAPGAVDKAYRAAAQRLTGLLDELCDELPLLRRAAGPDDTTLRGPVARRMHAAVGPFGADMFITPMAAVAGSVADTILDAMRAAADLDRAFVNNGGDIALHCRPGQRFTIGLVDRPDRPGLFGETTIDGFDPVRGVATSGWRGRSFSLGIADAVTVLAHSAAAADAAATVIANAVDLPNHPAVRRATADSIQPDSDLGPRLVVRDVGPLGRSDIDRALDSGLVCAEQLLDRHLILGVALHLQGHTRTAGRGAALAPAAGRRLPVAPDRSESMLHA